MTRTRLTAILFVILLALAVAITAAIPAAQTGYCGDDPLEEDPLDDEDPDGEEGPLEGHEGKGPAVCPDCEGNAEVPCYHCEGTGKVTAPCKKCGGSGFKMCSKCKGAGRYQVHRTPVDCGVCGGHGKKECVFCRGAGIDRKKGKCPICSGKKNLPCWRCNGTGGGSEAGGPEACPTCYGGEDYACGVCRGTHKLVKPCVSCRARGRIFCPCCFGKGRRLCPRCKGTKLPPGTGPACHICDRDGIITCRFCSSRSVVCGDCRGLKYVIEPCDFCKRGGRTNCPTCNGFGRMPAGRVWGACPKCLGVGGTRCVSCTGNGRVEAECDECKVDPKTKQRAAPCAMCKGAQSVPCPICKGRGVRGTKKRTCFLCAGMRKITCPYCNGSGASMCHRCRDKVTYIARCETCRGRGFSRCDKCSGRGKDRAAIKLQAGMNKSRDATKKYFHPQYLDAYEKDLAAEFEELGELKFEEKYDAEYAGDIVPVVAAFVSCEAAGRGSKVTVKYLCYSPNGDERAFNFRDPPESFAGMKEGADLAFYARVVGLSAGVGLVLTYECTLDPPL